MGKTTISWVGKSFNVVLACKKEDGSRNCHAISAATTEQERDVPQEDTAAQVDQ